MARATAKADAAMSGKRYSVLIGAVCLFALFSLLLFGQFGKMKWFYQSENRRIGERPVSRFFVSICF